MAGSILDNIIEIVGVLLAAGGAWFWGFEVGQRHLLVGLESRIERLERIGGKPAPTGEDGGWTK